MPNEHLLSLPAAIDSATTSGISAVVKNNYKKTTSLSGRRQQSSVDKFNSPISQARRSLAHTSLEDKDASKRQIHLRNSREAGRKLSTKRDLIREQLEEQIYELEVTHTSLLSQVEDLHAYKQQLEGKCKQMNGNI